PADVLLARALVQRRQRRFARRVVAGAYRPRGSVVVPAYDEEQVVVRTVESLLAQRYAGLEVLVVDDGSPDRTAQVVAAAFRGHPGVRLVRQPNGGKARRWSL